MIPGRHPCSGSADACPAFTGQDFRPPATRKRVPVGHPNTSLDCLIVSMLAMLSNPLSHCPLRNKISSFGRAGYAGKHNREEDCTTGFFRSTKLALPWKTCSIAPCPMRDSAANQGGNRGLRPISTRSASGGSVHGPRWRFGLVSVAAACNMKTDLRSHA